MEQLMAKTVVEHPGFVHEEVEDCPEYDADGEFPYCEFCKAFTGIEVELSNGAILRYTQETEDGEPPGLEGEKDVGTFEYLVVPGNEDEPFEKTFLTGDVILDNVVIHALERLLTTPKWLPEMYLDFFEEVEEAATAGD